MGMNNYVKKSVLQISLSSLFMTTNATAQVNNIAPEKYRDPQHSYWVSESAAAKVTKNSSLPFDCNLLVESNLMMVGLSQILKEGERILLIVPKFSEMWKVDPRSAQENNNLVVLAKFKSIREIKDGIEFTVIVPGAVKKPGEISKTLIYDQSKNVTYMSRHQSKPKIQMDDIFAHGIEEARRLGLPGTKSVRCIFF